MKLLSVPVGLVPVVLFELLGTAAQWVLDDQGTADPADDTLFDGSVLWHRV